MNDKKSLLLLGNFFSAEICRTSDGDYLFSFFDEGGFQIFVRRFSSEDCDGLAGLVIPFECKRSFVLTSFNDVVYRFYPEDKDVLNFSLPYGSYELSIKRQWVNSTDWTSDDDVSLCSKYVLDIIDVTSSDAPVLFARSGLEFSPVCLDFSLCVLK